MRLTPGFERHTPVIDLVTPKSTVSNPDPDTFYSPGQVPNYVEDPVGEVLQHSTEVIRRRIQRREVAAVEMTEIPIARAVNAVLTHEIPRDGRPNSNPTLSTTSTSTNAEPPLPLQHRAEVIRRRIQRREVAAVEMTEIPIARAANAVLTHEIPRDARPKSNPTLSTTSTATNTEPPLPLTASRDYRNLIARQQTTMRNNINSDPQNAFLDGSTCHYHSCPYSVGGLMAQRFALMQRLRQINMVLYGDEEYFGE